MDNSQLVLSKLLETVPECVGSRQKLKAVLLDMLPTGKREVNLLLDAYDEDIVEKLQNPTDPTLYAFRLIKTLSDDYGLTKESATWSVLTWCYILGKSEIASILEGIPLGDTNIGGTTHTPGKTHVIGIGVYRAGFDFKAGDVLLKHLTKELQSPNCIKGITVLRGETIDCYVNSSSAFKGAKKLGSFTDSCHLEISDGQYLIIKTTSDWPDVDMIKIELTEYN